MEKGPSAPNSSARRPTWATNSCFLELPFRIRRSKTPDMPLEYSEGKAPVRKSDCASRLLFIMLMGPPVKPG